MVSDPSTLKYILSSPRFAMGHSQRKTTTLLFGKDNMLIRNGMHIYVESVTMCADNRQAKAIATLGIS
jgi:hypothetical protein